MPNDEQTLVIALLVFIAVVIVTGAITLTAVLVIHRKHKKRMKELADSAPSAGG